MTDTDLPAEQMLYPSKVKWGGIALFCAIIGALVINCPMALWLKAILIIVLSIGVIAGIAQGFLGKSWLKLTRDGFEFSRFGDVTTHQWIDVSAFDLMKFHILFFPVASQVSYAFRESGASPEDIRKTGLPDSYGLGNKRLIKLMNEYRDQAIGVAPPAQ